MFLSDVEGIVQVSNMVVRIQSIVIDEIRSKDMGSIIDFDCTIYL